MIINSTGALRFGSKRSGPSEWAAHPGERLQPGALRGPRMPVGVSLRWSPGALGPAAPDTWRSEGTVLGSRSASLCRAGTRTGTPPPRCFRGLCPMTSTIVFTSEKQSSFHLKHATIVLTCVSHAVWPSWGLSSSTLSPSALFALECWDVGLWGSRRPWHLVSRLTMFP